MGTKWEATSSQKEAIDKDIEAVKEWGDRNNRPMYIGEFGAYSRADFNSRFRWTEYMVQAMEQNQISWSYWEFCSGFGAWDQKVENGKMPIKNCLRIVNFFFINFSIIDIHKVNTARN